MYIGHFLPKRYKMPIKQGKVKAFFIPHQIFNQKIYLVRNAKCGVRSCFITLRHLKPLRQIDNCRDTVCCVSLMRSYPGGLIDED